MTTPPEPDEQAADARQTDTLHVDEVSADISDVYWIDAPVLIIFWILLGIVMLQFVTRYVFNDSVGWTEEIARYLLIFLTFIGSVTCVRQGAHIFLEFFYRYVPLAGVKPLTVLVELINTTFFSAAGYLCVELAIETAHQNMVSINLPKGIIYWTVAVCCFAMALLSIYRVVQRLRTPTERIVDDITKPLVSG